MLYEVPQVEYVRANSIEEAVHWLHEYGEHGKILAGGTDLLGLMKDGIKGQKMKMPTCLIDVKHIPEMKMIKLTPDGLVIGAAVVLRDLEENPLVREGYEILAEASREIATLQIRNMGTIGGNLCQRPWCWYFRHPHFDCYKKGGRLCYAITGQHQYYFSIKELGVCVMAHPSDMAPALMALDSTLEIAGPNGVKEVRVEDFFRDGRSVSDTILQPDEIVTQITVPNHKKNTRATFVKNRTRHTWDFALASTAIALQITDGICEDARIVLGGIAPRPLRAKSGEKMLIGNRLTEELAGQAAQASVTRVHALRDNLYKEALAKTLVKRAILKLKS